MLPPCVVLTSLGPCCLPLSTPGAELWWRPVCVQSFLTLYTSCVRELVQLLKGCRNAHPQLADPAAPFASETEMRVQSLVRPAEPSQ